jgi:hypothetical protein
MKKITSFIAFEGSDSDDHGEGGASDNRLSRQRFG